MAALIVPIVASCGGSDDTATPAVSATDEPGGSAAPQVADEVATDATEAPTDESSGQAAPTSCDAIFSMAEMEEFLAEPVELSEETNDSLGQLVCTWESIEDPDDTEDFAFKLVVVQVYSGSPIEASSFFDPSMFEDVTMIDGIGQLAYTADSLGTDYYFVDDPIGGTLSYTEVDMGDADAPKLHTSDDVEQLFRTFHERVT